MSETIPCQQCGVELTGNGGGHCLEINSLRTRLEDVERERDVMIENMKGHPGACCGICARSSSESDCYRKALEKIECSNDCGVHNAYCGMPHNPENKHCNETIAQKALKEVGHDAQ